MALVGFAGGIGAMSGSVGQVTYSHNRFGPYVRRRAIPVNPNTNRQTAVRTAAATLASRWSTTLTQLQRDQWEVYAANIVRSNALGAQIKLTGFNHFLRSNVEAMVHSRQVLYVGPTNLTLPDQIPGISAVIDVATQQIAVTFNNEGDWASQPNGSLYVYMSQPHNAGTNFIGGPYRFADVISGEGPGPVSSPISIDVPFPVGEGQVVKVAFRVQDDDARISDRFFHQSTVVAA